MTLEKLAKQILMNAPKKASLLQWKKRKKWRKWKSMPKASRQAQEPKAEKEKKQRIAQVSDEKQKIFKDIVNFLQKNYDISVEKDNKLLKITENGKVFKLDLIETRQKKG